MKEVVQFGAGNIGRGFLAELFHRAGYRIIFVEKDARLVEEINRRGSYTLEMVGPRKFFRYEIDNIMAIKSDDQAAINQAVVQAKLMAVSVGVGALPAVSSVLSAGLKERYKKGAGAINIIIAENILKGETLIYNMLEPHLDGGTRKYLKEKVGLVPAVISRMVPVLVKEIREKDLLYIKAEEYAELPVDKKAFRGEIPGIEGMRPYEHFEAYEERKLFIHNHGHALAAYLGFLKGYEYIYEAMADKWIEEKVRLSLKEVAKAMIKKYTFFNDGLPEHIEDLLQRFANQALADTVRRVARDPLRKLRPGERLVGACRLIETYDGDPAPVSLAISAGLLYKDENDASSRILQEWLKQKGRPDVLQEVCGLRPEEKLYHLVEEGLNELGGLKS